MKKFLAVVLSLVLVFTLVAFAACNGGSNVGGNNFKTLDLENEATRKEFVDTLAEKADVNKLIGNPAQEGWTFGLEEKVASKLAFNLDMTPEDVTDTKLTAKGNVELTESAKVKLTSNGSKAAPDIAASFKLGAKGDADLSEGIYDIINSELDESLGAIIKKLATKFNYSLNGYVDKDGALIELSDGLYGNLPENVQDMLGSKKIKLPLDALDATSYAATTDGSDTQADAIKTYIDTVIVEWLVNFKISVSVATNNSGYALKISANTESIVSLLDYVTYVLSDPEEADTYREMVSKSITDAKFELIVRLDKDGGFSSIKSETSLKLNLDVAIPDFLTVKGTMSVSGSVEISKFSGKITKISDADYKLPAFMAEEE